jgi:hypothetical protein
MNQSQIIIDEIKKNGNTNLITESGLSSGKQIFAIGDSHTIFFHNSMRVKEHWGFEGKIPLTIYTLLQNDLNIYEIGTMLGNNHELYNIKEGDNVIFFYGYNDIQKNIHLHAKDRWQDEINLLLYNYIQMILRLRETYKINIIIPCIYPNPRPEAVGVNCVGSNKDRQLYTITSNNLLKCYCEQYTLSFLDIYDKITDHDGFIRSDMTTDHIHLDYNNEFVRDFIESEIIKLCF